MKTRLLTSALALALSMGPQAGPRDPQNRPVIEPVMSLKPVAADATAYELMIYGDIGDSWWGESVSAQSVVQQLNELDNTVATLNVRINSYGGSVADGLAIFNALKRHPATKAVTIDGVAMSSASLIAMAGDSVHMPATSILMIHAPWGGIMGNAKELRQYADVLDTFSDAMADAYVAKSGKSRDDVLSLLKDGDDHYYTGDEAVAEGFADAVDADAARDDNPSENARAFASALTQRFLGRAPANYAQMAIAATLRATHGSKSPSRQPAPAALPAAPAAAPNPPAPTAEPTPPADAGNPTGESNVMKLTPEQKAALAARREEIDARMQALAVEMETAKSWAQLNYLSPSDSLAIQAQEKP